MRLEYLQGIPGRDIMKTFLRLTLIIGLFLWAAPVPRADKQSKDRFELQDVFQLQYASDPQVSPDGKRIVYVRNFMDIMKDRQRSNLWIINNDGTEHRPLTSGNGNDTAPRWSPDGKRLVYLAKVGDVPQLFCRWLDNGQTAQLTRGPFAPANPSWSPDGKQIAFSMHVPEKVMPFIELPGKPKGAEWADPPKVIRKTNYRFDGKGYLKDGYEHLFVMSADGGAPRQVTSGPYHHPGPAVWTPNGKALIFSANRHPQWELNRLKSGIYEVNLSDETILPLGLGKGPETAPTISPNGKRIAYVGFEDKHQGYQVSRLFIAPRWNCELKLERDILNAVWKGKNIFFSYDDRGITKVSSLPLDNNETRLTILAENIGGTNLDRPYSSGSFSVSDDGTVAFTLNSPEHPADVAVAKAGEKPRRLTFLNDGLLKHKKLGKTEEIWFKSSHDGRKIQGWIVKPPDFDPKKKYPLILEIHGGPFANYGPRFAVDMQLYAAAGYVVFYANPRGSTSYGQEFGNLIHHNYPGHDYDDLMSGVDAVLKRGYIDERNLFVTGGSGGGVLTAWIVGKTKRFRAAVVCKPVINWYSFVLTADIYAFFTQYWFPGNPWDHAEHYLKRSPISLAGKITTPTMILTGEEDHRTPISESEQLYQALKLRQVDTLLVRIPGASHNIAARPSNMMNKAACVLKWFETYRGK
jgi:acylaminoacyl-peptidase